MEHHVQVDPIPLAALRRKQHVAMIRILSETPHVLSAVDLMKAGCSYYQLTHNFKYTRHEILEAYISCFCELKTLVGHRRSISSIKLLGDGMILSSGGDGKLLLWDMPRGDCLQEWDVHSEQVNCFAALDDGTIVLGCGHVIKHWDPINAQCIRTIEDAHGIGQAGCIYSLLKLTDGRVLSVSFGMKTWDIATGICTRSWEGRTGDGLAALQLRDGRVATGCGDSMITLWDVSIESPLQGPLKRLRGHTGPVYALAQLHGDHLASGSWDATIRVWDISDYAIAGAECTALLRGHSGFVWCLAVLSGGIILASGSNDGTIRLWNTLKGECLKVLTGHTRAVYCLEVLSDGITIVSGSMDNTIRVWGDEGLQRLQASTVTHSGRNDPESGAV